jgi:hypothetical protein
VTFVLLGRDRLDWADYSTEVRELRALKQVLMGDFSERDAHELLGKRQFTDGALQEEILDSARDVETKNLSLNLDSSLYLCGSGEV